MKKKTKLFLIAFFVFLLWLFFGSAPKASKIEWGTIFSQKHAQNLGLDWKKVYLSLLDDLNFKNIKIITHWDLIEPEKGKFNFQDLDWQIKEAEKRNVKIILVIGMKTGRWPECHIPNWITQSSKLKSQNYENEVLNFLTTIIERYKDSKAIFAWQVENEPFLPFGECPKIEKDFVKREINLVKSLDKRPIIFADSGEFSFWIEAAKLGDIVSTTLHRRVYFKEIKTYIKYPFPPNFYWLKKKFIETFFGKKVIVGELQAEPWCKNLLYNCDPKEQEITMDFEKFKENIQFAKRTGFDTFYLWGGEWWYWLKENNQNLIWEEVKNLLKL